MRDKIYGSVYGALIGDALGAPTEMRTREQIIEYFGGYVKSFVEPPNDVFAKGRKPGHVTDDFSIAYYLLKNIVESNGVLSDEMSKNAIFEWSDDDEFCPRYAGPTTMMAINKLKAGEEFDPSKEFGLVNYNNLLTNGAAMKIFPIGLKNGNNHNQNIEDVILVAKHTHFTNLALAGACAIACSVGEALSPNATIDSIIEAGLYGAKYGEIRAKEITGKISAGPSIEKRILLALEVADKSDGFDNVLQNLSDYVGTGVWVTESVPCVYGILKAFDDPMTAIIAGVNIGSDTDTIATMTGAILGAFKGESELDKTLIDQALQVNNLEVNKYVEEFIRIYGY